MNDRLIAAARAACENLEPMGLDAAERLKELRAAADALAAQPAAEPIDMVLHCPACGLQHIDAPEHQDPNERDFGMTTAESNVWTNPPHRSHLCHNCGYNWRPADVPTNGVPAVKTKGRNDSPIAQPARAGGDAPNEHAVRLALIKCHNAIEEVLAWHLRRDFILPYKVLDPLNEAIRQARAALAAAPQPAPAEQIEHLDVRNHVLERGMRALMVRLATLLDEDQFKDCEAILRQAGASPVEQPAGGAVPATSWGQAIEQAVDEFLADYEMRGEDDEGRDGYYTPTADELFVIKDAFMGLMADDAWIAAYHGAHGIGSSKEGGAA